MSPKNAGRGKKKGKKKEKVASVLAIVARGGGTVIWSNRAINQRERECA